MQKAGQKTITLHEIPGRNHGTVMTRVNWPGDEVAKRMIGFVKRYRRVKK